MPKTPVVPALSACWLCCLLVFGLVTTTFAAAPPAKVPGLWLVWIDSLGDDRESRRERAARKLTELGEDVIPALRHAARSHVNPDVRRRAAAVEQGLFGEARSFPVHDGGASQFALSPDGKHVATCANPKSWDPWVRVWDVATGKQVVVLEGHRPGPVTWSKDGTQLITGGNSIILWDAGTGKKLKTFLTQAVHSLELTPDGSRLVTAGNSEVSVRDPKTCKTLAFYHFRGKWGVRGVRVMPDGKHFLTFGPDGYVRLIEISKCKQVRTMDFDNTKSALIAIPSADGKRAAIGGQNGTITVCDVATGKRLKELSGHAGAVGALAFSADGKGLISGGSDRTLRVWDVAAGQQTQRFDKAHDGAVTCVAFLPGERSVLTSGHDKSMKVWRIRR